MSCDKNAVFFLISLLFAVSIVGRSLPAYAQDSATAKPVAEDEEEKEEPRTGVIATRGTVNSSAAIDVDTGGSTPGDKPNVIVGSVSPSGDRRCTATVKNQSTENTYKVRFIVQFTNSVSSKTESELYSTTLKPEQVFARKIRCNTDSKMALVLRSAELVGEKAKASSQQQKVPN